jgi:Sigma-70 factor, region 1.1
MLEKAVPETPLLDLSAAAVKELIRRAKKRGSVTHDQISALLSAEEVNAEQIEDILAKFSATAVGVVSLILGVCEQFGTVLGSGAGTVLRRRRRFGLQAGSRISAKESFFNLMSAWRENHERLRISPRNRISVSVGARGRARSARADAA